MKTKLIATTILAATLLSACNSSSQADHHEAEEQHEHTHDHDDHDHDHDHDHDSDSDSDNKEVTDEIHFTQAQAQAAELAVEEVRPAPFSHVIRTSGQILSAQGDEATIVATANGIVSFAGASMAEGRAVRSGESVVTISSRNLPDGDPNAKATILYQSARREYERAEKLVKDQIISTKEYEQIRREYETAKTAYEAQASGLVPGGVRVTAPIGGYIKNLMVNQGDYVSVGQPIATVSQNRRLQLRAEVSEPYFRYIREVRTANFKTSYDNRVYNLSALNGKLLSYGRAAGGQSFYLPVTFEFDNVGDIVPGSFVTVYLLSAVQESVLSVPVSAVTEEQGLYFVYLQLDAEGYRKQEVKLGPSDGERVQVLSGIKEGDSVVTRGVYQVKLAAIASVMPEGHTH